MNPINRKYILAISISILFIACNPESKKEETSSTSDSTSNAKTDTTSSAVTQPATMDATAAAPNLYKVLNDSAGIRILEATYKPGDSSSMHSHPINAAYVISPGTVQFTGKDGTKQTVEFKTGMEMIRGEDLHS